MENIDLIKEAFWAGWDRGQKNGFTNNDVALYDGLKSVDGAWEEWKKSRTEEDFQSVSHKGYSESGTGGSRCEQSGGVEVSSDDGYVFDFGSREKIAYNCTRCSEVGILPLTNYCPYCGAYVKWVG